MIETSLPLFSIELDKRKLVSYTILAFVLGSFLGGTMWNFAGVYLPKLPPSDLLYTSSLVKFGSSEELVTFIGTRAQEYYYDGATKGWGVFPSFRGGLVMEAADSAGSAPGSTDYSGTNVQVEGVDEADLVKTDGAYIYLVSGETVYIVRAHPPEDAGIVAKIEPGLPVSDLYINGDKLVVISAPDYYYYWYGWDIAPEEEYELKTTV
ncbi:MAG: beta-propeller domain-containing protein, partial [Candidatus Bathyarchaeia archaeon]